jgi:small subunit ribosomal protein S3
VGQKVNPIGFRTGIRGGLKWPSRWFARKGYADLVNEDIKIRSFLLTEYKHTRICSIEIERFANYLKIIIYSALPGYLIGKKGQDIENLKKSLSNYLGKSAIEISVQEVADVYLSARAIAQVIAEQIEKRVSFKKSIKKAATDVMKAGAKGIKVCVSGRLDGAEIARSEWVRLGSVSLHTLRSNIDYSLVEAKTTYGIIGVKVWISKGNFQNSLYF